MIKPILDQRRVKRIGEHWTIETMAARRDTDSLCQHCGLLSICTVHDEVRLLESTHGAVVDIRRCQTFRPIIGFNDLTGLTGDFNTFRLGGAWASRVRVGAVVSLADTRKNEIVGSARVTGFDSGPLREMLDHHAIHNHMMVETPISAARDSLHKILLSNYGPQMVRLDRVTSVIYLQRIDAAI